MKKLQWTLWILLTLIILSYFGYTMFYSDDKSSLLIGEATHGHFQIELACDACHSEAFSNEDVLQNACTNCHADELKEGHDSHPIKKFTDPRNADRLAILDARYCMSCHSEHQKEQTMTMGVTVPEDYCFHCHQDVTENRPSHKDLEFNSCASAGCHNYHDNRALYEKFLVENADKPWLQDIARIAQASATKASHPEQDLPPHFDLDYYQSNAKEATQHWLGSSHSNAGVDCQSCHESSDLNDTEWVASPSIKQCQNCHEQEANGFRAGKHGMRLTQGLTPMTANNSGMPFKQAAAHQEQGCNACHSGHAFDTQYAAKEACLACHNDEHSLAFETSKHGALFSQASAGNIDKEEAVSCATCHMPRLLTKIHGESHMRVEHNQNANLRPNEKMIRPVCMQCHSLEFSIDALADDNLIKNNFNAQPKNHIPSIDWAIDENRQE